jgi:hypothetical protein
MDAPSLGRLISRPGTSEQQTEMSTTRGRQSEKSPLEESEGGEEDTLKEEIRIKELARQTKRMEEFCSNQNKSKRDELQYCFDKQN